VSRIRRRCSRLVALRQSLAGGVGAFVGRAVLRQVISAPGAELIARTNYRGREVSLAGGVALPLGATAGAVVGAENGQVAAAAAIAGLGSGLVGAYDDLVGVREEQRYAKGFHGHLAALRRGQVTSGMVKLAGVGVCGLGAAMMLTRNRTGRCRWNRTVDLVLDTGIIAGTANLVNLLDLRPGRALKAGIMAAAPLASRSGPARGVAAGTLGAAAALIPEDLGESTMLGDSGANALGALLGTTMAARTGRVGRVVLLAGLVGLTAASERVSFTKVIASTPGLRQLDEFGRRTG
jgi:UDP-N-acetylmuramyl pentapeptide phosphotransferase/UDP-N-acetylglucosamine-1-phosphate transferase